jgi:hypothetical protein
VYPIGGGLRNLMGDKDDFRGPKLVADPKHDESENKQVVQGKMAGNIGSGSDPYRILGEKVPKV